MGGQCCLAMATGLALWCSTKAGSAQSGPTRSQVHSPGPAPRQLFLVPANKSFDVRTDAGLARLMEATSALIELSERQEVQASHARRSLLETKAVKQMTFAELKAFYAEPNGMVTKKDRRGLKELRRQCQLALSESNLPPRAESRAWLLEIARAINNNHRSPAPASIEFLHPPFVLMDYAHNPVAKGDALAANLQRYDVSDLSQVDPRPSSFWQRPDSISSQDLSDGFRRSAPPDYENPVWTYHAPKTSYGGCPGFEAAGGKIKLKVKFAETTSEPFAARIFDALGYNVEPTDYVSHLKIRYDRRFLREFHLRKDVQTKIRILWLLPVHTIHLQKRYDPFDYIDAAIMKDGARIPGQELKAMLFSDARTKNPEDRPGNFRKEVEREIDYLVTVAANVQIKDDHAESIGPWEFEGLGHEDRRELRGAGLLGAWIGWFDSRWENTRLKVVETGNDFELKHYFTDLGGGLGKACGPLSRHCEDPNAFGWTFTRPWKFRGKGKMTIPFRIVDYEPIQDTLAFEKMTRDDARWMARLVGQLTETQIVQALVASGFDSGQAKIYTEKLISRRDRMVCDLGLAGEIALLRPNGIDRPADLLLHRGRAGGSWDWLCIGAARVDGCGPLAATVASD